MIRLPIQPGDMVEVEIEKSVFYEIRWLKNPSVNKQPFGPAQSPVFFCVCGIA